MKWLKRIINKIKCKRAHHSFDVTRVIACNAQEVICKHCHKEFLEEDGKFVPLTDRLRYLTNNAYRRFDTAAYLLKQNVKEPKR